MEFRWVAAIALWTLLIGPVLGPPVNRKAHLTPPTALGQQLAASPAMSR